jgi:hypothetical protein
MSTKNQACVDCGALIWTGSTRCRRCAQPAVNPRPCAHCGLVYQPLDNAPSRKYCSRECSNLARQKREERVCAECGAPFIARTSEIRRRGGKYCSRECWRKNSGLTPEQYRVNADRMSVKRRGKGNPRYKHGKNGDRARLSKFSLAVKGEPCCRNCGSTERMNLHHIIPRSMFAAGRDEIRNGLPLCAVCHSSWHRRGRVTLYRDIFTEEEWAYLSSVTLLGQNIEAWLDDRYPVRPQELAA